MPRHLVRTLVVLFGVVFTTLTASAQAPSPFTGRWVIDGAPWFDQQVTSAATPAGGRGRGAGAGGAAQAPAAAGRGGRGTQVQAPNVILQLNVTASGAVMGIATGTSGRRGAPGSHPAHDVEITRGGVDGDVLTFQIWRFDGYHNRMYVTARVTGDALDLEFRRDTPSGPDTFTTRARRVAY